MSTLRLTDLTIIVWMLLLFGGQALGKPAPDGSGKIPAWARLASSVTLTFAGWLWLAEDPRPDGSIALIAAGMSLGLVGDLFMTLRRPGSTLPLACGVAAFGLGHIAYSAAFWSAGRTLGLDAGSVMLPWLAWLAAAATGWYILVLRGQKATAVTWGALPYALLLTTTAWLALALAIRSPANWPVALGGALFLLSDLILAARVFRGASFRNIQDIIWLTYGPAQACIVFGLHL